MSHNALYQPLRQHSDTDNLKQRTLNSHNDSYTANDSSSSRSTSHSSSSSRLRTLLLPAQLEIRRVAAQYKVTRPKRFATDSSFHLHHLKLVARQSSSATSSYSAEVQEALRTVTTATSCQEVLAAYQGDEVLALRQACTEAVRDAFAAARTAAASASATATATRTTTSRLQTVTVSSAATGRVAAVTTESLNPSQALAASVSSRFAAAESVLASRSAASVASRASIQASVEVLFSSAEVEISSRRASRTASSSSSTSSLPSSTSSSTLSSTLPPSSSSSKNPSSTSSGAGASSTAAAAGGNRNLAKIVAPAVIIPLAFILLVVLILCCLRRRKRRNAAGLGPIGKPQPMRASPRAYGTAGGAALAGAGVGAAAAAGAGNSQESFGTTHSNIGVAFSEPRTRWGRRSLVDVLASGVRSANSTPTSQHPSGTDGSPVAGAYYQPSSSIGHGRQASLVSAASIGSEFRGVGGYNSHSGFGYQPGQPRPVMTPLSQHYEPYHDNGGEDSIVAVPASAQRRHGHDDNPSSSEDLRGDAAYARSSSGESIKNRFVTPPPVVAGYAHAAAAQQSRSTHNNSTDPADGYYTADPGMSSQDSAVGDASEEGHSPGDEEELRSVNFGSSSGSGSGSMGSMGGIAGATPRATSSIASTSTPRIGMGHGSGSGVRRNDGTGSWWN